MSPCTCVALRVPSSVDFFFFSSHQCPTIFLLLSAPPRCDSATMLITTASYLLGLWNFPPSLLLFPLVIFPFVGVRRRASRERGRCAHNGGGAGYLFRQVWRDRECLHQPRRPHAAGPRIRFRQVLPRGRWSHAKTIC